MTTTFTKANIIKRAALILLALVLTCATAWAEDNSSYFTDNGTAPSWDSNFPATATVASGEDYEFQNVTAYASGTPSPTVALTSADSDDYLYDNDIFLFNTNTPGTYAFIFTATNVLGTADATLTVTVTAPPVTVPTLTIGDVTATTANATWTACDGVSSYTLQLASDDQFSTGGGSGGTGETLTETFANISFTTTSSSYTDQTISGGDLGTWTATSCRGDQGSPVIRFNGTLTSPTIASGVATVEFDYDWPYSESGSCDIELYVGGFLEGITSVTGGTAGTATYTLDSPVTGPTTIEFLNKATSNKRMRVTKVRITTPSSGSGSGGSLIAEYSVSNTEYTFTNLTPYTIYYARVKGDADWSKIEDFLTDEEVVPDTAPVWSAFPTTTVNVGEFTDITISDYVTGKPTPTITLTSSTADAGDYDFDEGALEFLPSAAGTFTFTFIAANSEGSAEATLTITVPVTIPTLTISDITANEALATWTACDGVSSYTIQLASDDQFSTGGSRTATPILSEDFSGFSGNENDAIGTNGTLNDYTATPGWTGFKVYTADKMAKVGASKSQGWIMTPALDASGTLTVAWSAYRYGTSDNNTLLLGVSENGIDFDEETITIGDEKANYTNTFTVSGPTVYVRWMASGDSKARFYLDDVSITISSSGSGSGSLIATETVTDGTNYTFTGLTPETTYYTRVKGNAAWSNIEEFTTTAVSTAPSWDSSFPTSATVAAGEYYEFENVSTYASGSPSPTIALTSADSEDYFFDNDTFLFNTIFPGTYDFTFTATNNLGTADVTLTVTVTATTLTGYETSLAAGVFLVNSDITYNSTITLTGDVILFLGEGKTMTVNTSSHGIDGATNNKNLTIYGETEQGGTLSVTVDGDGICCENITINSGTVNVTSNQNSSISAQNLITINGGVVTATSESGSSIVGNSGVSIKGGQVTAAGYYGDIVAYNNSNITLGYTNATDFISFKNIDVTGTGSVKIADGKVMTDGTNTYDSNTASATLEALTNTTLRPVTGIANCDITVPNQTLEGPNNPFENICYKFEYANNNYSESYAQEFIAGMGVVVKDGETVLALGTDYLFGSVTYANGEPITESQIGDECKVEIVGQGNYTGSQWASFTIIAPDASGTWGDSNILTWAFHDGTLSITGTGEMKSAANNNDYPWFSIANYVKTLTIGEGITNIAASAFAGTNNVLSYGNLTTVNLPSTLTTIGFEAFAYCIGLNTINNFPENATVAEQAFYLVPCVAAVTVTGYGDSELSEKWVFIASPLSGSITPNAAGNLVGSYNSESGLYDYDLYRFNQSSTTGEWENSVQHNTNANPFVLENGKGYLYASKTTKALIFVGTFNTSADTTIALTYDANAQFAGWNLVGNPFNEEAYVNRPFYKMNDEGTDIEPVENYDNYTAVTIPPCTGIMVQAEGENETVRFSTTQPSMTASNNGHLQIALAEQVTTRGGAISNTIDKAILSFNEDAELGKFYFGSQNAHIYIPQDNEEYAIAFAQKQGEMPLNFKATRHGNYTITVSPAAVEMGYLHLIDHLTGADIDLLQTPSYTFEAKTTDYASRFKLVFAAKDLDTLDDDFAFISNGEIFVNSTGTLQVIDVLGHQLLAKQLLTPHSSLLTPNFPTGVYVLRLVNGEQVRTQKIVVR